MVNQSSVILNPNSSSANRKQKVFKIGQDILLAACIVLTILFGFSAYLLPRLSYGLLRSEAIYDFGDVPAQGFVTHTFTLRNLTAHSIFIQDYGTSCGCTSATFDRKTPFRLAPLAATKVKTTVDMTGETGLVEEGIIIAVSQTTSGSYHRLYLYVRAHGNIRNSHPQ